jgi:hypothetical protein
MSDNDIHEVRDAVESLMKRLRRQDDGWLEIFNELKGLTATVIELIESGQSDLALTAARGLFQFLERVEDDVSRRMAEYEDENENP